jgi:radical SAM protein with 4Fe4S-binding SPASM domain
MRKEIGFMDIKLFKKIIDDLPTETEQVYLHKQGESLLHPQISEMMKYIKDKRPGIQVKLNTNGSKLTTDLMKSIVKYLDVLTISIWSIRPETYHKLHGRDKLSKVMDNLRELLSIRENEKSEMEIWIDYVNQEGNCDESEEEVINFFKNAGYEDVTIAFYWAFSFLGFGAEGNYEINKKLNYEKFPLCIYPWVSFTITWDGKVDYCFVEPREDVFLGDLNTENFASIWNNEKYVKFRKSLIEKKFDELEKQNMFCKYCTFIWSSHAQSIGVNKEEARCELENKEILEKYLNKEGKSMDDFNPHYVKISNGTKTK